MARQTSDLDHKAVDPNVTVARRRLANVVSPIFYALIHGPLTPRRQDAYRTLMRTQGWSMERQRDVQQQLLRRLLAHALANSPWYQEHLHGVDPSHFRLEDLGRLPILEKSDLQDHLDEIVGNPPDKGGMHEAFSGGSTGTPVRIYQSREYRHWHGAGRRRELTMCGPFRLGMALAFFWGRGIQSRAHRGVVGSFRDVLVNLLWFDAFSLRRDGMIDTIRRLRAYRPSFVVGYASILAEVARALDRPLEGVLAVESTAETLTPPDRLLIAQGFGAPIFDRYATNELGTLAHECQAHDGLHLVMENTILEIVDPGGRTLTDARAEGEVVVTNLRNLATPLVRYRLGDVARVGTAGCVCGRGSLRLEAVVGRSSDLISCPRGTLLHSLFFIKLFYGAPVRRFRVDQETPTRLRVRVVPGPAYTDEVRQRVTSLILTQGDPGFQVEWEIVEDIPPAPSGKFRVTVNHVVRATSGDSGNLTAG